MPDNVYELNDRSAEPVGRGDIFVDNFGMNLIARLFLPRSVRMEKSPTIFIADSPTSFCLVLSTCRNLESIMSSRAQQASTYLQDSQQRYESRNPKSKVQHERAARHLPGGNTRSVLHGSPFPLCMASGRENRLVDIDGHEYVRSTVVQTRYSFGLDTSISCAT